jgi:hypothetical protein
MTRLSGWCANYFCTPDTLGRDPNSAAKLVGHIANHFNMAGHGPTLRAALAPLVEDELATDVKALPGAQEMLTALHHLLRRTGGPAVSSGCPL